MHPADHPTASALRVGQTKGPERALEGDLPFQPQGETAPTYWVGRQLQESSGKLEKLFLASTAAMGKA